MSEELEVEILPCASAEAAVRGTDIVVVATNTTGHRDLIAYRGAWMEAGQHVNSIGSTGGNLREIDPETFRRATRIGMDSVVQVEGESGDAIAALEEHAYDAARVIELKDLVANGRVDRGAADAITLFKSVGSAVQDVMAGWAVYREALRLGRGTEIDDFLELKRF
jgi:ornithine cyclodeaminase/alanine dehydrogenase-like protein (mu-crystallin family)